MKIINKFVFTSLFFFSTNFFSTNSYSVEIIPLFSLRGGGEFIDQETNKKHTLESTEAYGLILSFPADRGKTYEVYYSHQSTQLNSISFVGTSSNDAVNIPITIDYLHFGGTTSISDEKNFKTFMSGGIGFTYLSPDAPDTQSDLRASLSIGIGLKWPITERVALRLEARGLATLYNNNSAIFCNGGCTISINGNYFLQAEILAGLGFTF